MARKIAKKPFGIGCPITPEKQIIKSASGPVGSEGLEGKGVSNKMLAFTSQGRTTRRQAARSYLAATATTVAGEEEKALAAGKKLAAIIAEEIAIAAAGPLNGTAGDSALGENKKATLETAAAVRVAENAARIVKKPARAASESATAAEEAFVLSASNKTGSGSNCTITYGSSSSDVTSLSRYHESDGCGGAGAVNADSKSKGASSPSWEGLNTVAVGGFYGKGSATALSTSLSSSFSPVTAPAAVAANPQLTSPSHTARERLKASQPSALRRSRSSRSSNEALPYSVSFAETTASSSNADDDFEHERRNAGVDAPQQVCARVVCFSYCSCRRREGWGGRS